MVPLLPAKNRDRCVTGAGDLRLGTSHPLETLVDRGGRGVFETTGVAAARIARRPDGSLCPQGCVFWGSSARRRADKASTMSPAPLSLDLLLASKTYDSLTIGQL